MVHAPYTGNPRQRNRRATCGRMIPLGVAWPTSPQQVTCRSCLAKMHHLPRYTRAAIGASVTERSPRLQIRTKFVPGQRIFAIALVRHGSPSAPARWRVVEGIVSRLQVIWQEGNEPKIAYAISYADRLYEEVTCFATRAEADARLESIADTMHRTANLLEGIV